MSAPAPSWVPAFALADLPRGASKVFARGAQRVAVFRLDDGALFAIDDRCPHEGYPLAKGFVNGCVVTCRWHAFRYDLRSGQCLVGDEHARAYPVRVHEDVIELDLAEPDPTVERARHRLSLERALARRRGGQIARDVVRLLDCGASHHELAMMAVRWDARRAPDGLTHTSALAHDLLALSPRLRERHGPDGEVAALVIPLDLAAEGTVGYGDRRRPAPEPWDPATLPAELRRRVEAEDGDGAEALVRGAVEAGVSLATLRGWLRALVSEHLLDFGHGQIYLPKLFALLEAGASRDDVDLVLGAFARSIALAVRDELLPEWSWVVRAIEEPASPIEGDLAALVAASSDGSRKDLCGLIEHHLAHTPIDRILDALVVGASVHLLRYDLQVEHDPTIQDGWLDVTHALTHASAVRDLIDPADPAGNRRLVYFAAAFVHTRAGLDAPADLRPSLTAADAIAPVSEPELEPLQRALDHRDCEAMVALAAPLAAHDPEPLVALLEDHCLLRGATRPVFGAHQWKTLVVATLERERLAASTDFTALRHLPLVATARFLASDMMQRDPMRQAHEAIRFVRDARVPRRRT